MSESRITCSELSEIDPAHPCIATIEGDGLDHVVAFTGEWGTDKIKVTINGDPLVTLTWREVKELERALNLLAHVVTRTGEY